MEYVVPLGTKDSFCGHTHLIVFVHVQSSMCRYYLRAATNRGMASVRTNTVDNVVYINLYFLWMC